VRFIAEGLACSFDAEVLEWDHRSQTPCVRVTWPATMAHTAFRKFERIPVRIAIQVRLADGVSHQGRLRDLSLGGCGTELTEFVETGTLAHLTFTLPDGSHIRDIEATARGCHPCASGHAVGFQFSPEQEYLESDIAFYIRSTLERKPESGPPPSTRHTVLIIDSDADSCARIRRGASRHAGEVQLAGNALDGIYKVRAASPVLVAIRQDLPDLAGVQVCKLIRSNELTSGIRLFLFGGETPELAETAKEIGVDEHFPEGERMLPNLIYTIGSTLSKLGE
jgi:CheY-like chemotaxis protein